MGVQGSQGFQGYQGQPGQNASFDSSMLTAYQPLLTATSPIVLMCYH